ncbi:MAG: sigma-70 family RNA polymerase sigma factor [Acidithiobacillus sp.]|nr:sigma-70 family RNA polymerase sigma factor [Acidithiobacillus sp.]
MTKLIRFRWRKKILTKDQEEDLADKIKNGDQQALALLILSHLPLIKSISRQYRGKGEDFEDLVQEGYLGLMKAAKRYEKGHNARFSTYASLWVQESMRLAVIRSRLIRLPDYLGKALYAENKTEKQKRKKNAGQKVLKSIKIKENTIKCLEFVNAKVISLDEETETEEGEPIAVDKKDSIEQEYENESLLKDLQISFLQLEEKYQEILELRFGFYGKEPITLEKIAEKKGVTREAIRQMQERAINKLKKKLIERGW